MSSPATRVARSTESKFVAMDGVLWPMFWLATPVLVETVLTTLVGFVDTYLTGHFVPGEAPMAAIGLMAYSLWLLGNMFAAVSIGTTALVARFIGAGKRNLAERVMNQAFLCGTLLAVVAVWLTWSCGPWFVRSMNLEGAAGQYAVEYLSIVTFVLPCIMIERVGIAALRAAGDTFSGFVAMTLVNIVNAMVGMALVTGWGASPKMGWRGLAIGTAAGHIVGAGLILALLLMGRCGMRLTWRGLRPNRTLIYRLLRVGIPGAIDVLTINGCHLWFLGIVNGLGTLAAAAHSLTIRVESIAYLPGGAFGVSAATMVGQYLGANDRTRARQSIWANFAVGAIVMSLVGSVFYFHAETLMQFFAGRENVATAELGAPLLRLATFALPALAATMIMGGALRGAGDTRWPFLYTILGMIGVRIPLTIYLACETFTIPVLNATVDGLGWGVIGAWYAMLGDIVLRAMFFSMRVLRERWMETTV